MGHFTVHHMIFNTLHTHRLECASAHVQGYKRGFNAPRFKLGQSPVIKMQAGGRSRHRTGFPGVHRLVAFAVRGFIRAIHVGRQRHMTDPLKNLKDGFVAVTMQVKQRIIPSAHP